MKIEDIITGCTLTWLHEPRGGYGYVIPVDALVLSKGNSKVKVEVKLRNGGKSIRFVNPDKLKEKIGGGGGCEVFHC